MLSIINNYDFVLSIEAQELIRKNVFWINPQIEAVYLLQQFDSDSETLYDVLHIDGNNTTTLFSIDLNPEGDPVIFN